MRNLLLSVDGPNLVDGVVDAGTETSVHAEETIVDDRCQGEVVEYVSTIPPHVERTILS